MLGVPGVLLLVGAAFAWLLRRMRSITVHNAVAAGCLLVMVPFLVHSQLELPHAYAYFLVPVGILLGLLDARTVRADEQPIVVKRGIMLVVAAAWTGLLGVLAHEYTQIEEDFRVNRFENRRLGRTAADYQPPEVHFLTHMGEMLQAMRLRANPGMSAEDLALLVRTSARYSWAPMHYRTALALGLNGRTEEARHQLALVKAMFPPPIYEEGRLDWIRMGEERYPQLKRVPLP
jgi:hypothetical protein